MNLLEHELFGRTAAEARKKGTGDIQNAVAAFEELLKILEEKKVADALQRMYRNSPDP